MKKLVIIPAFNESGSILRAVQDIKEHAPGFDYVVINDCSTDDTLRYARKMVESCESFRESWHWAGSRCRQDTFTAVRTIMMWQCSLMGMDSTMRLISSRWQEELVQTGSDMVIGSRFIEKEGFQSSGLRRVGIRYFSTLIRLVTGARVTDPTSGMRMVNRDVMKIYAEKLSERLSRNRRVWWRFFGKRRK